MGRKRFYNLCHWPQGWEGVKPEQVRRPADAFIRFATCGCTGENQNSDFPCIRHSGLIRGFRQPCERCESVLNFCCAVSRKDTVDFYLSNLKYNRNEKLFTLLAIALFGVAMWSCSYDDDDLWKAVDDLDSRMEAMEQAMKSANTDIDALQKLVDALQKNVTVTSVIKNNDGYTITFSNGETATITNGKNGIDAPAISVKKRWRWPLLLDA